MLKRKILFFTDWYPPAYKAGGPIVSVYNLSRALKNNFEILVLTGTKDLGESNVLNGISPNKISEQNGVQVIYQDPNTIKKDFLGNLIGDFNPKIIWVSGLFSAKFSVLPILRFRKSHKLIVSPRGMLHPSALQIKSFKKKLFLTFIKLKGIHKDVLWHATNYTEKEYIQNQFGNEISCLVASNLSKPFNDANLITEKAKGGLKLLVLGRIAEEKNSQFALEVLAASKNANIQMHFYGNDGGGSYSKVFHKRLKELQHAGYKVGYKGSANPAVLEGEVFPKYHYMYLPTQGENFGHAISDSLANSTPVLISDKTPWTELASHGCHVVENQLQIQSDLLNSLFHEDNDSYSKKAESAVRYYKKYLLESTELNKYLNFLNQL